MRTGQSIRQQLRAGFTLIEVLTVVAIISILAALLLPALTRAKESARGVTCINNMHQFALATMNYTMDHDGNVPGFWTWLHKEDLTTGQGGVTNGSIYRYLNCKRPVYQSLATGFGRCPNDRNGGAWRM